MAGELHIALLGHLQIHRDGIPLAELASAKAQALLAYLAVTGRPHSRDELAGLLWGEMPEADAKTNLRQALTLLRRCVGAHLIISREEVEFDRASPYWLDVKAFQSLISNLQPSIDISRLRSAVALYRGDFLEGFYVRDAPGLEEWALAQREHYRERALDALRALAGHYAAQRDCERGLECARRLLALDPWREEAHRQVMLLLARSGQRSAALAQFETCRRVLAEQLGVEPARETTALYERVKRAASAPPHNLPAQPTSFVGRAEEIAQIESRLLDRERRLLTLVGLGGIGKTRLALQAAAHLANIGAFLDGVYFVPLASLTADSADALVFALANACGLTLKRGDPKTQLLDYARDKEILFVLDNLEHLLAQVGFLTQLLKDARDVKLLVTSRERLNVQWEWVFQVEGLGAEHAARLFVERAQQVEPRFSFAENQAHIAQICQLVQGMPLGIELAAAWVKVHVCAEIAREIERTFDFLAAAMRDAPERQRSLRAVFEYSWQLLTGEERRVLRALSVFRGGFTRDAAEAVVSEQSTVNTVRCLAALIDNSLLRRNTSERYDLHELVRQFAEEKLEQAREATSIRRRHAEFFLKLAEQAEPELAGKQQTVWFARLENDHDNFRAALRWAMANGETMLGLQLAGSLWRFWYDRSYFHEGRNWLEGFLALAETTSGVTQTAQAKALHCAGVLAGHLGDMQAAQSLLEQGLALRRELGDARAVSASLNGLGILAERQCDYDRATACWREGLALCRELGDKWRISMILTNLGILEIDQAHYEEARALFEEGVGLCRELGDKHGISNLLNNLGLVAHLQGDLERAQTYYQECLNIVQELGDKRLSAIVLSNLADMACLEKDNARAIPLLDASLALNREIGDKWGISQSLLVAARIAKAQGDYARAEKLDRESLVLKAELGDRAGIAFCLEALAGVACAHIQPERVARLLGAAETIRRALRAPVPPVYGEEHNHYRQTARTQLGDEMFDAAWNEGGKMSLEQAVAFATSYDFSTPP